MDKRFGILLLPFLFAGGFMLFLGMSHRKPAVVEGERANTQATTQPKREGLHVGQYEVHMQTINPSTLRLIPNFDKAKTSSEFMSQQDCVYGANGGFYVPEGKPLGLFESEGKRLGLETASSAANAFLVRMGDTLSIRQTAPNVPVMFALQAGPYLLPSVTPTIANDEHARRVLVAHTKDEWYFLVFTNPENAYEGPLLSEIPSLLQKLDTGFVEAINLDGGTASAFYGEDGTHFGELTAVGSFFCGK